jgi:hypothetical protein
VCALETHRHLNGNAKHGDPVRNRHLIARHLYRCAGRLLEARRTIGVGALVGGCVLGEPLCVLPEVGYLGRHLRWRGARPATIPTATGYRIGPWVSMMRVTSATACGEIVAARAASSV